MNLTLKQLRYFVAIAAEENMTRAASKLNVSPTALSLQMKLLEEQAGQQLLERHSRGVTATRIGRELMTRSREILSLVEQTEALFEKPADVPRHFRIGMPPSVIRAIGFDLLESSRTCPASYDFELHEGTSFDLMAQLSRCELDFAIGFELQPDEERTVIDLLDETLVFLSSPGQTKASAIRLEDALRTPLTMLSDHSISWTIVKHAALTAGLKVPEPTIVGSMSLIMSLVAEGRATTIAARSVVAKRVEDHKIIAREIAGNPLHRAMGLAATRESLKLGRKLGLIEQICALVRQYYGHCGAVQVAG
jgi:LysR family nitrogen assimilation transcriptional regulator